MSQELKPCPFCGEKQQNVISNWFKNHLVECENCCASAPAGDTKASAIAEWNRRAHDEVIEKCRVALENIESTSSSTRIRRVAHEALAAIKALERGK